MSFRGELVVSAPQTGQIQDAKFIILDCSYKFSVPTDSYGRIAGRRVVGKIELGLETTPASIQLANVFFTHSVIEGKITFFNRDSISKMLEVEFSNARIIDLDTNFQSEGSSPISNRVVISSEKISLSSDGKTAEDSNDWEVKVEY